jgi:5-formyltetrahydrofolate cyclo-ligase
MDKKQQLRRRFREHRHQIGDNERKRLSQIAVARVMELGRWKTAGRVLLYAPMGDELDVAPLIEAGWALGKSVLLPKCEENPRRLELYEAENWEALMPGRWGIWEPDSAKCSCFAPEQTDFAIIPVVAMDRSGYRLGNGGGYYDRLMPRLSDTLLIGFDQQLSEDLLPRQAHDVAAKGWLTPTRYKWCEGE